MSDNRINQNPHIALSGLKSDNPIVNANSTTINNSGIKAPDFIHAGQSYDYKPIGYDPRPFQQDAINRLQQGKTLLVTAPTGAGKTVIAYAAMMKALYEGRTFIYTAPLKAISQQKLDEFKIHLTKQLIRDRELWRDRVFQGVNLTNEDEVKKAAEAFAKKSVGLITGDDQTENHLSAPVKIMTTEIYNLMSQQAFYEPNKESSLKKNRTVVFDENHYLGDPDRGWVWEESIMFTPPEAQIIGLSATVGNARELIEWMQKTVYKDDPKKVELVEVGPEARPIPLRYFSFNKQSTNESKMQVQSFDGKETWSIDFKKQSKQKTKVEKTDDDTNHEQENPLDMQLVGLTKVLKDNDKLPAIFFRFSRVGCDKAAMNIASDLSIDLVTPNERTEIEVEIKKAKEADKYLAFENTDVLLRGVAAHHSEHLPSYKKLVEKLFERGLIKAVCATTTLAAGINMPARTVVITELEREKYDEFLKKKIKEDLFTVSEVKQMSGRAGRPGVNKALDEQVDKVGNVIFMCDPGQEQKIQEKYIDTDPEKVKSNLKPHYQTLLTMLDSLTTQQPLDKKIDGFIQFYLDNSLLGLQAEYAKYKKSLPSDLSLFKNNYRAMVNVLLDMGYINKNGDLTAKGKIAKEIKFGHPLFVTEFIYKLDGIIGNKKIRLSDFAALLSLFAQGESNCEQSKLQEFMQKVCNEQAKKQPTTQEQTFIELPTLFPAFIQASNELVAKQFEKTCTAAPLYATYENFYAAKNWTSIGEKNTRGLTELRQYETVMGKDPPGKTLKGLQRVLNLLGYLNKARLNMRGTSMPFPNSIKKCLEGCLERDGRSPAIFKRGILAPKNDKYAATAS